MEGNYPVFYEQSPVGKVQLQKIGLYCSFYCRCRIVPGTVCRLVVQWKGGWENLGILVPEGDALELKRKLPAKRLGEGQLKFQLIPSGQDINELLSGRKDISDQQEKPIPGILVSAEKPDDADSGTGNEQRNTSPNEEMPVPEPETPAEVPESGSQQKPERENPEEAEKIIPAPEENTEQPIMEEKVEKSAAEKPGTFYPIGTDMAFEHLDQLERGILVNQDGQTGVLLPEEERNTLQSSSESPTGQWSEPSTSE